MFTRVRFAIVRSASDISGTARNLFENSAARAGPQGRGGIRKKCPVGVEKSVTAQNDGKNYCLNDGGMKHIS